MEEAAWAIEAIVFVYFCYCLQKKNKMDRGGKARSRKYDAKCGDR